MYWGKYGYYGDLCSFMEESRSEEKLQQSIQGWKLIKKYGIIEPWSNHGCSYCHQNSCLSPPGHWQGCSCQPISGGSWVEISFTKFFSHPCCPKDDNSGAWISVLVAGHARRRTKALHRAYKAPQGQEGPEVGPTQVHLPLLSSDPLGLPSLAQPLSPPQGIAAIFKWSSSIWRRPLLLLCEYHYFFELVCRICAV